MAVYHGNPVSAGVALGPVIIHRPFEARTGLRQFPDAVEARLETYQALRQQAQEELLTIAASLAGEDDNKGAIFQAQATILMDVVMDEEVTDLIGAGTLPDEAIHMVFTQYADILGQSDDALISERASDIKDVRNRLLRVCAGEPERTLARLPGPSVVVARDLLPSDTATLDRENVLAIVTEVGGQTSHTAIIARSYGIPALLGVARAMELLSDGQEIAVDALSGELVTELDAEQRRTYEEKRREHLEKIAEMKRYLDTQPVLRDGQRIDVHLNIAYASEHELSFAPYADGVGLFRTEFLYMGRAHAPSEEEQQAVYERVLEAFGQRPVILRTMDIGGDKTIDYMDMKREDNPFLGNRALRLCFEQPQLFRTQLRAALRAALKGNLWLMLPMVGSLDDIRRAKSFLTQVKEELRAEGVPFRDDVKLGIMIEIPSIAMIADHVAREVDFASIGTNDLCQYLLAVDRLNPDVAPYYQGYHPGLFRLMGYAIEQFTLQQRPIGVCGELGGDPHAAAVLVGLGMRKLSMSSDKLPAVKKQLQSMTLDQAQQLAKDVLACATAAEVSALFTQSL